MFESEATCTVLRLISEVPSHWRSLNGTGKQIIKRLPLLVRKCADSVALSIRYDVTVVQM